jgi:hypothetical protein
MGVAPTRAKWRERVRPSALLGRRDPDPATPSMFSGDSALNEGVLGDG